MYIQDSDITGLNNVNQHLRVKPGSSFKSLFKSIWNICLFLFQKWKFNIFWNKVAQARYPRHVRKHVIHATHASSLLAQITRHFSNSPNYSRT